MKYTAHWHRFGGSYSKEFRSAKKAAQFLLDQEYLGRISWDMITDEDMNVVADGTQDNGYEKLYALGATQDT